MYIKKLWPLLLSMSLSAEILIVQKVNNIFEPFPGKKANKAELDTIADILLTYQWPMCIMNENLSPEEWRALLFEGKSAEAEFITKKLHAINPNYYAFWVPTTFFHLVCLDLLFNVNPHTIFSDDGDIGENKFLMAVRELPRVTNSNNNIIDKSWKNLLLSPQKTDDARKKSFRPYQTINNHFYKKHSAYFTINRRVAEKLFFYNQDLKNNINNEDIYETVISIIKDTKGTSFVNAITEAYMLSGWSYYYTDPSNYPIARRFDFKAGIDRTYLQNAITIEYNANDQNKEILFRGTAPFTYTELQEHTTESGEKKTEIITHEIPIGVLQKPGKGAQITPSSPYSISFGNSLFAGSLADFDATPYYYLWRNRNDSKIAGFAIYIDKSGYRINQNNNLFLLSPLSHIASLFGFGEMFHSRSIAVSNPKKVPTKVIGLATVWISDPSSLLLQQRDPREQESNLATYFIDNSQIIYSLYSEPKEYENIKNEYIKNLEKRIKQDLAVKNISMFMHKKFIPTMTKKKLAALAESLEALAKSTISRDISAPDHRQPIKTGIISIDNTNLARYIESMTDEQLLTEIKKSLEIEKIKEGPIFELIQSLKDARARGIKKVPAAITFRFAEGDWQLHDQLNRIIKIMKSNNLRYSPLYDKLSEIIWDLADGVHPQKK